MNRRATATVSEGFLEHLLPDPKMPHCFFALLDNGIWVHFALHPETGDYYEIHHERLYIPSVFERVFLRRRAGEATPVVYLRDSEGPRRTFVIINSGRWRSMKCLSTRTLQFLGGSAYQVWAA
jgi:hypothetical protein